MGTSDRIPILRFSDNYYAMKKIWENCTRQINFRSTTNGLTTFDFSKKTEKERNAGEAEKEGFRET